MNNQKWADYIITAVSETSSGIITHIQIGQDSYGSNPAVTSKPISYAINLLNAGKSIVTVHKDSMNKYRKGGNVKSHTIAGTDYLRSDPNQTTKDNLSNLPKF
jgi:hypothetical protein